MRILVLNEIDLPKILHKKRILLCFVHKLVQSVRTVAQHLHVKFIWIQSYRILNIFKKLAFLPIIVFYFVAFNENYLIFQTINNLQTPWIQLTYHHLYLILPIDRLLMLVEKLPSFLEKVGTQINQQIWYL